MHKTITIKCPFCNKSTSIEIGDKNLKTEISPILVKDISTLTGENTNPEFTLISYTKCGHNFFVHNKKLIPFSNEPLNKNEEADHTNGHDITPDDADNLLLVIGAFQDKLNAIKFFKAFSNQRLKESKEYVERVLSENNIKTKGGCFIATVCYGDYDAGEVVLLRKFRDEVLMNSYAGRAFVRIYYSVSPFIARQISKSEKSKSFIKKFILNRIVNSISKRKM